MKVCLYRGKAFGKCKECQRDYDTNHHPNNYDCRDYVEINLLTFNVKDKTLEDKTN